MLSDLPAFRESTQDSLFYYSHDCDNLDDFIEKFFTIENDLWENQYKATLEKMCDKYSNEYNTSAKKVCKLLKDIGNE